MQVIFCGRQAKYLYHIDNCRPDLPASKDNSKDWPARYTWRKFLHCTPTGNPVRTAGGAGYTDISIISITTLPAGMLTVTLSPFLWPRIALAIGVPTDNLPSRRLASLSDTSV